MTKSENVLKQMAELRAAGAPWAVVARDLSCAESTLHRRVRRAGAVWKRMLAAARSQLAREALAESVHTLRQELRSDDERSRRDAAGKLMRYGLAMRTRSKNTAKSAPAQPRSVTQLVAYVQSLSDEELDRLIFSLGYRKQVSSTPQASCVQR